MSQNKFHNQSSNCHYLLYRIAGYGFCLPVEYIDMVLGAALLTKIPVKEKGFLGLLQINDQFIPIFSGFELLDFEPKPLDPSQRIIVCRNFITHSSQIQRIGLLVEDVLGVSPEDSLTHYQIQYSGLNSEEYISIYMNGNGQKYFYLPMEKYFQNVNIKQFLNEVTIKANNIISA